MELFETIHTQGTAILLITHEEKVAARAEKTLLKKDGKNISAIRFKDNTTLRTADKTIEILQHMRKLGGYVSYI